MVTTNAEGGDEIDLEQRLGQAWQGLLGSQETTAAFLNESKKKSLGGAQGQIAFFN